MILDPLWTIKMKQYDFIDPNDYEEWFWQDWAASSFTINEAYQQKLAQKGSWQQEPDKVWFLHQTTGFFCQIQRHCYFGTLNGYIAIPKEHSWHDKDSCTTAHGGITFERPNIENGLIPDGGIHTPFDAIIILSHNDMGNTIHDKDLKIIGFDTAHFGDHIPFGPIASATRELKTYKDIHYMIKTLDDMAKEAFEQW